MRIPLACLSLLASSFIIGDVAAATATIETTMKTVVSGSHDTTVNPPPLVTITTPPAHTAAVVTVYKPVRHRKSVFLPNPGPPITTPSWNVQMKARPQCYGRGQSINRATAVKAIDDTCAFLEKDAHPFRGRVKLGKTIHLPGNAFKHIVILVWVEVKPGCEWDFDQKLCQKQFRRIVDECDTESTEDKDGGWIETECLSWRFDVQVLFNGMIGHWE